MPPGQQQQGGQGGGDNSLAPLWILLAILAVGLLIWYSAHQYIVFIAFKAKLAQAYFVEFFTDALLPVVRFMQTTPPAEVDFATLNEVSTAVGNVTRYPIGVILLILGVWLYFSNATLKFRKTYSMKTLRDQEKNNWSQITPVVKLDLVKQDINKGPWAMALSPMEFAQRNGLLRKDETLQPGQPLVAAVRRGEAKRVFTLQLGPYWEDPEHLPIYVQALFAALAAKANRDRDGAVKMFEQINKSAGTGKLNFSGVRQLLHKHYNTRAVQEVVQRHAYLLTIMASLLQSARADGVMASADFLWLKPVDRRLWYMMNSIGRQTPHTEVAGPYAHWLAEKELHRKSMVPMVDEAVKALEGAIKEVKLKSEEYMALS